MQTRLQVQQSLLQQLIDEARTWSESHGRCQGTLARAVLLLDQGLVHPITVGPDAGHWEVGSLTDQGVYLVNGACNCLGSSKAYKGRCSHRIAAALAASARKLMAAHYHRHSYTCHHTQDCWDVTCLESPRAAASIVDTGAIAESLRCDECDLEYIRSFDTRSSHPHAGQPHDIACECFACLLNGLDEPLQATWEVETDELPDLSPLNYHECLEEQLYEPRPAPTTPAPVVSPQLSPLPEAPVSLCFTFKTSSGAQLTYTMRGRTDAEVLERIPTVLSTLERQLTPEPSQESWWTRICNTLSARFQATR